MLLRMRGDLERRTLILKRFYSPRRSQIHIDESHTLGNHRFCALLCCGRMHHKTEECIDLQKWHQGLLLKGVWMNRIHTER